MNGSPRGPFDLVVIGCSAGGVEALKALLPTLPAGFPTAIAVVLHLLPTGESLLPPLFQRDCRLVVKEVEDKEEMRPGTVYFAPPNYHVLVERDRTFSLSVDAPVNYSRPSIDMLFESAAAAFGPRVAGVVLTGANSDGALGLRAITDQGGYAVVQDPATTEQRSMPEAALKATTVDLVRPLQGIAEWLKELA
jgi:two-component system chemotaxis response regulator CheB